MKRKIYLLLSIVVVSLCFHMSIKADVNDTSDTSATMSEEETIFDYSKMDKEFKYKEEWESYYDISFCSSVSTSKSSYAYTGKKIKPNVNVLVHDTKTSKVNKVLDKKYYTIEWENNVNPGTATAIVKGINGFYGEKKVTFKIKMPNVKINKVSVKGKKITVKTKEIKIKGIKYQIRYKKNTGKMTSYTITYVAGKGIKPRYTTGKWKTKLCNKNNFTTKKLKKGNYFLQVRSYIKIDGKEYYGTWKAYNSLINIKTKRGIKNKSIGLGNFYIPNSVNKIWNKNNGYYFISFKNGTINGVQTRTWRIWNGKKLIYTGYSDKYGNIIYEY